MIRDVDVVAVVALVQWLINTSNKRSRNNRDRFIFI